MFTGYYRGGAGTNVLTHCTENRTFVSKGSRQALLKDSNTMSYINTGDYIDGNQGFMLGT